MDLPPVSYAPRNRQRPLPIVLPVMAGLGIGVSVIFALAWTLALRGLLRHLWSSWAWRSTIDSKTFAIAALMLLSIATHVLIGLTAAKLLRYKLGRVNQLVRRAWFGFHGLMLVHIAYALLVLAELQGYSFLLLIVGSWTVQMIYPAFLITTLRQHLVIQAYEREARRRALLGSRA